MHSQSATDSEKLDELFDQLRSAEPEQVDRLEGQIIALWSKSGSAALDLLLRRGEDAMKEGAPEVAVEHFTALIDHAPDFAEGYHGRATAYYQSGYLGPALDDLRQTLVLEPRHLGAMAGVALVMEELDRLDQALEVWHKLAEFSPADAEIVQMIERLDVKLRGEAL